MNEPISCPACGGEGVVLVAGADTCNPLALVLCARCRGSGLVVFRPRPATEGKTT